MPASDEMLPRYWKKTLKHRKVDLLKDRKRKNRLIAGLGARYGGARLWDYCDSDYELAKQPDTYFFPPIDQFDFIAALEHAPDHLWPAEADTLFEQLAETYRGYAFRVFRRIAFHTIPDLDVKIRQIVESDPTGRYFMHLDAEQAKLFWNGPISSFPWGTGSSMAVHWAAGFAFTRIRRHIRWDPFPVRRCTLCGTEMLHLREIAFFRDAAPGRWCVACTSVDSLRSTAKEVTAAINAYVRATDVIPIDRATINKTPHGNSGMARDVVVATQLTIPNDFGLKKLGLWPWPQALVAAGVVEEFIKTKRGYQSEASDGHWCKSMFERQIDDYLTSHAINHEHEPKWPMHPQLNPREAKRADWRLTDGTMVEAAGMLDDPVYAANFEIKRALAAAFDIPLIVVTPEMVLTLDRVFERWLGESTKSSEPQKASRRGLKTRGPGSSRWLLGLMPNRHRSPPKTE